MLERELSALAATLLKPRARISAAPAQLTGIRGLGLPSVLPRAHVSRQ